MTDSPERFGSYMIYEQLGVGGMASVHIAETRSAGGFRKRVALKRLLPHIAADPELVQSFIHEARLAGNLHHANIAQVFDFGKVNNTYFIAMELVPGPTLSQLVRQCIAAVGPIPVKYILSILRQACDALEHAHNLADEHGKPLNLIHRDVSPPNIVISNTGLVKLIDFGVAKAANSSLQTKVGTVKGKFSYIAPEYLGGKLDRRVDLWALGVVGYEMLTRKRLFDSDDDFKTMMEVRERKIPPPSTISPEVPPELDTVIMTALERDPDRRWQTAGAMRNALAGVIGDLHAEITNQELTEWVEWAFTQTPMSGSASRLPKDDEPSGLSDLIATLDAPSMPSISIESPTSDQTRAAQPRARAKSKLSKVGSAMLRRRRAARPVFVWLLVLALGVAVGGLIAQYGVPPEIIRPIAAKPAASAPPPVTAAPAPPPVTAPAPAGKSVTPPKKHKK